MKIKYRKIIDLKTEKIYEILKTPNFGLAYAEIKESKLHLHRRTTELYLVCNGEGVLFLGNSKMKISGGDVIKIPPNTPHKVKGNVRLFVISFPPWNKEDHILLE